MFKNAKNLKSLAFVATVFFFGFAIYGFVNYEILADSLPFLGFGLLSLALFLEGKYIAEVSFISFSVSKILMLVGLGVLFFMSPMPESQLKTAIIIYIIICVAVLKRKKG